MRRSPRELEHELDQLKADTPSEASDSEITVLWGVADPENRPNGLTWVPETNTLTYDLWTAQRDARDALDQGDHDIVSMLAGYGSGKTIFGARWLIRNALEYDSSRFLGMGIDFTKARDTTFRVLFEQLPGERTGIVTSSYNGPETSPIVQDYNRQNHRLTLVNDSVIKLGSADKWNRYAGDEYGGVWLDEPSHYGEDLHELLEMIGSRLRGVDGPKVQLWTLTGNGYNAAFDILERKEDSNGEAIGLNIKTVQASTLENPYLDKADKERFERQYGNTSREGQALYGGFADSTGATLSRDMLTFVDVDAIPDREMKPVLGVDIGVVESARKAEATDSDFWALALVYVDQQEKTAYIVDMDRQRGASFRQGIQWIAQVVHSMSQRPELKIESVAAQRWAAQELRDRGLRTTQVTPTESKETRIVDLSIPFENEQIVLVNRDVDDRLGYDPRWQPFVREWTQFGSGESHDDTLDAVALALHGETFSSPAVYSADPFSKSKSRQVLR